MIKKLLVLTAITFIAFLPVVTPTVYAVSSWSGNTWEGDTWSGNTWDGNSWDGSELEWDGTPWQGDDWEGKGTDGSKTDGSDWLGYEWNSIPWYMKGWSNEGFNGNGTNGNPWVQNGFNGNGTNGQGTNGNGTTGNPWTQDGFNGNGTNGQGTNGNRTNGYGTDGNGTNGQGTVGNSTTGNGTNGQGTDGQGTDGNETDVHPGKIAEYVVKDVMGGTAEFVGAGLKHQRYLDVGRTDSGFGSSASSVYGNMLVNGLKLAGVDNTLTDAYDAGTKIRDGVQGYKSFQKARKVSSVDTGKKVTNAKKAFNSTKNAISNNKAMSLMKKIPTPPAGIEKALSKFNVATAAVGTVASGIKTFDKINNASEVLNGDASGTEKTAAVADATASAGSTLMNAGVVTSAVPVPGARVAGGIMVAGGAVLWGASKATKFVAENWSSIKETGKKVVDGVKSVAKKGWDTITGLFG